MVFTTLAALATTFPSSDSQKLKKKEKESVFCHDVLPIILRVLMIFAVCLAFVANTRSKKGNPFLRAAIAFFATDIYLVQAGVRYALGDWTLKAP